jgi:hypothetical protein
MLEKMQSLARLFLVDRWLSDSYRIQFQRARNRSEVDALSIDRVIGELFGFSNPFAKSVNLVSRSDDK